MPDKLPAWSLNGGSLGGDGSLLQGVEYDGYLTLADSADTVHLAWQVLPHRAAAVTGCCNRCGRLQPNGTGRELSGIQQRQLRVRWTHTRCQSLELFPERSQVAKLAIHAGEAHVRNWVEVAQPVHHQLADDG